MRYLIILLLSSTAMAQSNLVTIDQIGSRNTIVVDQKDGGSKTAEASNSGDDNQFIILQQGTGQHSASIKKDAIAPNSVNSTNTLTITQDGSGDHSAQIKLKDPVANSNNNASITQSGGVGANKTFTLGLEGSGIGVTVMQNNPGLPDTGSMNIQCLTPPCGGYSYIRN
jgi:hypothetical protein